MTSLFFSDRDVDLYHSLAWQLTDAQNYPRKLQPHVLGTDMQPLIDVVFLRLKEDGQTTDDVPSGPPRDKPIHAAPMGLLPGTGVMLTVGTRSDSKVVWYSGNTEDIKDLIRGIATAAEIKVTVEE